MQTGPPAPHFDFEIVPVFELSCLASMHSKRCEINRKKWSKVNIYKKRGMSRTKWSEICIFLLLDNFFTCLQQQTTQNAALEWDKWRTSVRIKCTPLPLGWVARYHNSHPTQTYHSVIRRSMGDMTCCDHSWQGSNQGESLEHDISVSLLPWSTVQHFNVKMHRIHS